MSKYIRDIDIIEQFINSNDTVIFTLDNNYKYTSFNKKHKQIMNMIWGVDIEIGKSMLDYISSVNDLIKAKSNFDKALSGSTFELLEEYGDSELERHYYKDKYFPLVNEKDEITGLGVIVEELKIDNVDNKDLDQLIKQLEGQIKERSEDLEIINENLIVENQKRLKSEHELRNIKKDLEAALEKEMELNKLKTKFISMVSHEFRTPLTVIQATLYLLEKSYERQDSDKFEHNLMKIEKSIDNMVNLMENILNLGKLEQGEIKVSSTEFCVIEEIDELINSNKDFKKFVTLDLENKELLIKTDKLLVNQILNNLLSNSVKYKSDNPEIILSVYTSDTFCYFVVSDNGIGISEKNIDTITQPFKRDDKTTSLIKGTGLGLSIVNHNLELIGGEMKIESKENVGTKITIKIPI
ncbi:MAG: sensor histidine kinase [Chlorobiota bacterium]